MKKSMCELSFKELKEEYDGGDSCMLNYLKDFIPDNSELEDLYCDVCNYNEIYANGWTINDLFEMRKEEDEYWTKRANYFIKKYYVKESEYNEFSDFFDKYTELRDKLLDELGIDLNVLENDISQIADKGIVEGDIICNIKNLDEENSYTVARVLNFCHCVELHYSSGEATVEYGTKIAHDYWESVIEDASWFNREMSEEDMMKKLDELFIEEFGKEEFYAGSDESEICSLL